MRSIENTLALWISGLLSSEEVATWAAREIIRRDQPPIELFDLVSDGPEKCMKRAGCDFPPRPSKLTYFQAFTVLAVMLDLASDESLNEFANWAARSCMGEDLDNPIVQLGYQLDHLLDDCQDPEGAKSLVRTELPLLMSYCRSVAAPYIETEA